VRTRVKGKTEEYVIEMPEEMQSLQKLQNLAEKYFGHTQLRAGQVDALSLILSHKKVLITLPTGSGKSLLYGLTCLQDAGVNIVVSPLTALKREQAAKFRQSGIPSAHLSFEQSFDEKSDIWQLLARGELKLLFVSPERFVSAAFIKRLINLKDGVARVFIDEAHCMASWGFDFRPEYRQVGQVIRHLGVEKVVAMTATASPKTKQLIKSIIVGKVRGVGHQEEIPAELFALPLRPNVFVEAVRLPSELEREEWLKKSLLKLGAGRKIIVYVQRRVDAERLSLLFRHKTRKCICYHAGLGAEVRKQLEEYVRAGTEPMVVFATQAFGMGIDLPEVDRVVVYGFPSGIEEMLQMMGRAGRGGQPSKGTLLWIGSDPVKRMFGIKKSLPTPASLDKVLNAFKNTYSNNKNSRNLGFPYGSILCFSNETLRIFLESVAETGKKAEVWLPESFLSVLRLNNAVLPVISGNPVIACFAENAADVFSAFEALKNTDNQRLRVLLAMFNDFLEGDTFSSGLNTMAESGANLATEFSNVFLSKSLFEVQSETRLSLSQLEKVFHDFNQNRKIEMKVFTVSQGAWLVAPARVSRSVLVNLYKSLREERVQGFEALDSFARAHGCRLGPVLNYLDGKNHSSCGQCDYCLKFHQKASEIF
jgi:RecQ family ATP-dependent DNA helicase